MRCKAEKTVAVDNYVFAVVVVFVWLAVMALPQLHQDERF